MRLLIIPFCFLLFYCASFVHTSQYHGTSNDLTLSLYYETLCPDCQGFSKEQLCPTWEKLNKYFKIEFVPYGNAETEVSPSGNITIKCQHGPEECFGNRLHSCALTLLSLEQSTRFICCMESADDFTKAGTNCARKLGLNYDKIKNCANSPQGQHLHYLNGKKTSKLHPRHTFVPWILFNGKYEKDDMDRAQEDLIPVICKYLEDKPSECNEVL